MRRKSTTADLLRFTMSKFFKKKGPDALSTNENALNALSSAPPPQASPGLKKSGTSRWKRGKKPIEVKPEVNLALVLPSSDDFRTSLLMPNLSARFSMLREQDDPNSILGKASDDSVLQPYRRSRMDFGGLGDIAEVSSLSSAKRPRAPFTFDRQDSFASEDGYGSENDSSHSVLSRARPGEGNVMFGGRQKVYMIPKASSSSTRIGRAVYEDDIGMSAFQKYRREKELQEQEQAGRVSDESQGFDFGLGQATPGGEEDDHALGGEDDDHAPTPNDSAKDLSHSPTLSSYENKRSSKSTSHSEARSSTAATSVASQPVTNKSSPAVVPSQASRSTPSPAVVPSQPPTSIPSPAVAPTQPAVAPSPSAAIPPILKRADTKTRRLYEQGLDQHMYEQQASALTRLHSIQRQRTLNGGKQSPPVLQSTKSASNLQDRARQPVYALRAQSPEAGGPVMNTLGLISKPQSNGASPAASLPQSPTSPHGFDFEDANTFTQALEPADRGKATAMGAFNKPKQSFDEDQYLERQRQLQRSTSNAAVKKGPSLPSAFQQRMGSFEQERQRSDSNASTRSRSRSRPKKPEAPAIPNAYSVFQRAAQMNTQQDPQHLDKTAFSDTHRTFFGNISASDSEDEEGDQSQARYNQQSWTPDQGYGVYHGRWQPTVLPSVLEHPALRSKKSKASLAEEDEDMEPLPLRPTASSRSLQQDASKEGNAAYDNDSPTLVHSRGATPLNGLMHHLRQQSNQSSIFPTDDRRPISEAPHMADWNPRNLDLVSPSVPVVFESDSLIGSHHTSSNPWDLDEAESLNRTVDQHVQRGSVSPMEAPQPSTRSESRASSQATFLNRQSAVSDLEPEGELDAENGAENETSWQRELQKQHTRDPSTATQQERDAFANELAARRNAIQENIKSIVERPTQSRGSSPAPSVGGARKAFGMLRSKPSRESIDSVRPVQAPPKALQMLGIGNGAASSSTRSLNSQYDRNGYSLDIARSRDVSASRASEYGRARNNSASRPPMPNSTARTLQQSEHDARREWEQSASRSRENSEPNRPEKVTQAGRSPPSSTGGRSRANSEVTTGRSRSRTGPYRDDLEKAMVEGTGSSAAGVPELSPMIPRELTPRPSPDTIQSEFETQRDRSNSRAGMTNYFDQTNLHPIQTGSRELLTPGAPSPIILSPHVYSPGLSSMRSVSPFAHNMTPPLSGSSTPLSSTFTPPPHAAPQAPSNSMRPIGLRKKTVSKYDISEPTLVCSTSSIDVVDLPEGASLKNGMEDPPPIPPINPKRRATRGIFNMGRNHSDESTSSFGSRSGSRSKTPEPWLGRTVTEPILSFEQTRGIRSGSGSSPRKPNPMRPSFDQSPGMHQQGFAPNGGSPERVLRSPAPPVAMDGGMF